MNISCSICAELFRGPDAPNLHVTRCGHVFHNECLSKWLERKSTCPECRSKATASTIIRLFVNITDTTYSEDNGDPSDLVSLQSENDNLKFRLIEKDGAIKSKDETLTRLRQENEKLMTGQTQSRNVILALEQKLEQNKIIANTHNDQIKALRCRLAEIDHLREKLKEANDKNRTAELVQHLITSTKEETEVLLKEGRTNIELATMVTTLKRELNNINSKRAQIRSNAELLAKQLKQCKEEKAKLDEKCSVLESKVFQLESNNENKNDSMERLNNSENVVNNQSPTEQSAAKRTFGEHLTFHKKVTTLDSGRNVSPSMCIKASSIAGLSPLMKRIKSAESHKLSPLSDEKTETFSILRKPRLIHTQTKKSELRPLRLQKASTQSSVDDATTTSNDQSHSIPDLPSSSLNNRFTTLNSRFRLGSLSKPS